MNFAIFRRNFDENLPEFHRNCQEMTRCIEILRKSATKIRKMLEIRSSSIELSQSDYPFLGKKLAVSVEDVRTPREQRCLRGDFTTPASSSWLLMREGFRPCAHSPPKYPKVYEENEL